MLFIRDLGVDKADKPVCRVSKLEVARGERVAVLGPNGSGKTTLLRVVAGLEPAFTGECQAEVPLCQRVYVHQSPYLLRRSVLANATYGLAVRNVPRRERASAAREWLTALGLGHLERRQATTLSGGEQRRVALARALVTQADLLLLDEPFADLDQEGTDAVCRALSRLSRSTILIATPRPLPDALSARTYCLEH